MSQKEQRSDKMNEVLPRIAIVGGKSHRIIGGETGIRANGVGNGHKVIPRVGGISVREVLKTAGIARGGMVKVATGAKAEKKTEKRGVPPKVIVAARAAPLVLGKIQTLEGPKPTSLVLNREPMPLKVAPVTEKEERLTGLLEAAQEMKPLADKAEEHGVIIPELPPPEHVGEQMSHKKRCRRKRNRGKVVYEQGEGLGLP